MVPESSLFSSMIILYSTRLMAISSGAFGRYSGSEIGSHFGIVLGRTVCILGFSQWCRYRSPTVVVVWPCYFSVNVSS